METRLFVARVGGADDREHDLNPQLTALLCVTKIGYTVTPGSHQGHTTANQGHGRGRLQ